MLDGAGFHKLLEGETMKTGAKNHLAGEKSPYLIQHADNPVDWYPWGEEAIGRARNRDKPVFLSIGYSSCHWCHVMEEESFRDAEVASLLNTHFVAVKVDREERPDIDAAYMAVCQAMTGSGGWPLTIIMDPDGKPFFAGTYFPKYGRNGLPGLLDLLERVSRLWNTDRPSLTQVGEKITGLIRQSQQSPRRGKLGADTLERAFRGFERSFDSGHGGFGGAPKFPSPHNLLFLLRWWARTGEEKALSMASRTMDAMRRGGLFDHLGFGFHRYSTDERWHIPHFEKMLYDQAMMVIACIELSQATGERKYGRVAKGVIRYVHRDLTSPEGAFHCSEDADSEGEEGRFYSWTPGEIEAVLGKERGELFSRFFGVDAVGDLPGGRSVLREVRPLAAFARDAGMREEALEEELERSRRELFDARENRVRPSKDDKILTDWNGLMIAALAKASSHLGEPRYARMAARAAGFLLHELRRSDGRLLHRYREGESAVAGFLDDYAFLVWGLLELYEAAFDVVHLKEAIALTEAMLGLFWDPEAGDLFTVGRDGEELILRGKDGYDGATPSGRSIAALDLLRLARMTMREDLRAKAESILEGQGKVVEQYPGGFAMLLCALDFLLGPVSEVIVAGDAGDERAVRMQKALRARFLPRTVLLYHPWKDAGEIEEIAPHVKNCVPRGGEVVAYVCENFTCRLPTSDADEMISSLTSLRP